VRADPPSHPELLDWLAAELMEPRALSDHAQPWSMKHLQRLILLSAAWQQGSDDNAKASKIDPANQWFWRQNRQRLDLEAMRDTLLSASGQLDPAAGGRAVDIVDSATTRRTVYGFVERQNLPGLFRTFDFASPDTTSPQRYNTTVPQQALFMMNSPFVVKQAQQLLARPELKAAPTADERIRKLYGIAFQRMPDADELILARRFVASQMEPEKQLGSAWSYGYGTFDESAGRAAGFTPLPHWTGYAWQGGPDLPDPQLGWVILNAAGGHVGNDQNHAAIRRWRAGADAVIEIDGELNHASDQGDGVRARVVSSRLGLLGTWTAQHSRTNVHLSSVEVKQGDILDFVTDCRASVAFDSFHWAPVIRDVSTVRKMPEAKREWNAATEFAGPAKEPEKRPLSAWEKYAQVLLLANELMFVD
jgi:hypothetical protein